MKANTPVCKNGGQGAVDCRSKDESCIVLRTNKECSRDLRHILAHFGTRWAPCKQTIYRLCQQFQTNGSMLEKKRPRPASVRTPAKLWLMQGFVCRRLWGKTVVTLNMFFIRNNFPACED